MDKLGRLCSETKALRIEKVDVMSARQMNANYIYITYVRVTETDVVMYL